VSTRLLRRSWVCGLVVSAALATSRPTRAQLLPPEEGSATSPPKPEPPAAWPWGLRRASTFNWLALTLRGSLAHVGGVGGVRTTDGLLVSYEDLISGNLGAFDVKLRLAAAIGGGSGGAEGSYSLDLLAGGRGYFTDKHGPFVRAGVLLDAVGNGVLSLSYAAPAGEVGYQYIDGSLAFEIGALGGYVPGGNFGTAGGGRRDLGESPLLGAFAWMNRRPVYLRTEWQRFLPTDGGTSLPIDVVSTSGCVVILGAFPFCLDVRSFSGGVRPSSSVALAPTNASYGGVSFGIGGIGTRFVGDGS
jgi:hypothetical protein